MPDSDIAAAISARATSRNAHHEAGHAVAVVHKGGELCDVYLGTTDWSVLDDSADTPGATVHRSDYRISRSSHSRDRVLRRCGLLTTTPTT